MNDEEKKDYIQEFIYDLNDPQCAILDKDKLEYAIMKALEKGLAEGRKEGYEQGKNNERESQCGKKNYEKDIARLKKENAELKKQLYNLQSAYTLTVDKSVIREQELEVQNEKMKCGGNCKHSYSVNTGGCYDTKCEFTGCDCINCKDKWELRE